MVAKHPNELVNKLLAVMESRNVKVPKLSQETLIPKDRIYKWLQEGNNPKADDEKTIIKWIEKVPREMEEKNSVVPAADNNLYERLIEEKERARERAEKQADEYMQIIKDNLTALLLNSAKNQELLIKIWDEQTSDDLVMMNNQDVDSGKPAGTSAEISGNLQKALVTERKKVPQKSETGKREKAGR